MKNVSLSGVEHSPSVFDLQNFRLLRHYTNQHGFIVSYGKHEFEIRADFDVDDFQNQPFPPLSSFQGDYYLEIDSNGTIFPGGSHRFKGKSDSKDLFIDAAILFRKHLLENLTEDLRGQTERVFTSDVPNIQIDEFHHENIGEAAFIGARLIPPQSHIPDMRVLLGYNFRKEIFLSRVAMNDVTKKKDTDTYSSAVVNPALEANRLIYDHF